MILRSATIRTASSGVKRGRKTTDAPASSGAMTEPKMPSEWASGKAERTTSSSTSPIAGPFHDSSAKAVPACDNSTPLGAPVLPEV